jgi:hypothetical protein
MDAILMPALSHQMWSGLSCLEGAMRVNHAPMMRFFDMDDRARMPWRFYGATVSVLARG